MQAVNVNDVMLDPLAGFLPVMQLPGNADTFIESIATRLMVCIGREKTVLLREQLRKESNKIGFDKKCYIINELLYEFRKAAPRKSLVDEKEIQNKWIAKVISKMGQDTGLEFFTKLNEHRANREKQGEIS